jgi:hypothetical protein
MLRNFLWRQLKVRTLFKELAEKKQKSSISCFRVFALLPSCPTYAYKPRLSNSRLKIELVTLSEYEENNGFVVGLTDIHITRASSAYSLQVQKRTFSSHSKYVERCKLPLSRSTYFPWFHVPLNSQNKVSLLNCFLVSLAILFNYMCYVMSNSGYRFVI